MAKFTGNYTTAAVKALKSADRLVCQVVGDGPDAAIYLCSGYWVFKMNRPEYESLARPVSCCDPGNWSVDAQGRKNSDMDIEKIFSQNAEAAKDPSAAAQPCPIIYRKNKAEMLGFYNAVKDISCVFNRLYMEAIAPGSSYHVSDRLSPIVASNADEPFAMVLPIKPSAEIIRSIRAWFVDAPAQAKESRSDAELLQTMHGLEEERNAAEKEAAAARQEVASLREQLSSMEQAARETAQQDAQQTERETIDTIVARFTALPGVLATVKGAQTAAPVIWLSGDVETNADAIKQHGGRWSAKRSAYYFRVA